MVILTNMNAATVSISFVKTRLSIMMFLQYAIWGAWLPILYPFLMGFRKFSLDQTGYCLAAGAAGAIFGPFIAGQLADRKFATEKMLAVSHAIGAVLVWNLAGAADFSTFCTLSFIYGFVYAPTLALTNSLAFANISNRDRDFGPIRLWGTLGWIAVGILVGQMLLRKYTPAVGTEIEIAAAQNAGRSIAFQLSAILGLVMAAYCLTLPHTPPAKSPKQRMAWAEALGEIRLQPLVTLFLVAIPVSMIHQFYFVFTSDFLGAIQRKAANVSVNNFADWTNQIFGVGGGGLMTIGQMTEIVVLGAIPLLTKKFSYKSLLMIGLCAYALRMAIFANMPTLLPVMFGVALHGLCFGCFIFVAFMMVDKFTTKDVRATAQNLFNLIFVGVGIIVGSMFATKVAGMSTENEVMNYKQLFTVPMWMAIGSLIAIVIFMPSQKALDAKN